MSKTFKDNREKWRKNRNFQKKQKKQKKQKGFRPQRDYDSDDNWRESTEQDW